MTGQVEEIAAGIREKRYNLYITEGPSAEVQLEDIVRDVIEAVNAKNKGFWDETKAKWREKWKQET